MCSFFFFPDGRPAARVRVRDPWARHALRLVRDTAGGLGEWPGDRLVRPGAGGCARGESAPHLPRRKLRIHGKINHA